MKGRISVFLCELLYRRRNYSVVTTVSPESRTDACENITSRHPLDAGGNYTDSGVNKLTIRTTVLTKENASCD